jgi:hypothetical protein
MRIGFEMGRLDSLPVLASSRTWPEFGFLIDHKAVYFQQFSNNELEVN